MGEEGEKRDAIKLLKKVIKELEKNGNGLTATTSTAKRRK